jgi:hypothetical protein
MIPLNKYNEKINSTCKIETKDKLGSGFFLKIPRKNDIFYCLMTNEHIIKKTMIDNKELIKIIFDNQKSRREIILNKKKRFIQSYKYMNIDCSVVQIIENDNISEDHFLPCNIDYKNKLEELKNKEIYILQYPRGEEIKASKGKIEDIDIYNNQFSHLASTDKGSSGSPVFLSEKNILIGIHKQKSKENQRNYGDLIFPVILSIKNNKKYMEKDYEDGLCLGEFNDNNLREGYGKFIYKNSDYYIGQWHDNKRHNKGILYYSNKKIKYKGEFLNDEYDGDGIFFYENGNYIEGKWKQGIKNGEGIFLIKMKI